MIVPAIFACFVGKKTASLSGLRKMPEVLTARGWRFRHRCLWTSGNRKDQPDRGGSAGKIRERHAGD